MQKFPKVNFPNEISKLKELDKLNITLKKEDLKLKRARKEKKQHLSVNVNNRILRCKWKEKIDLWRCLNNARRDSLNLEKFSWVGWYSTKMFWKPTPQFVWTSNTQEGTHVLKEEWQTKENKPFVTSSSSSSSQTSFSFSLLIDIMLFCASKNTARVQCVALHFRAFRKTQPFATPSFTHHQVRGIGMYKFGSMSGFFHKQNE